MVLNWIITGTKYKNENVLVLARFPVICEHINLIIVNWPIKTMVQGL